MRRLAVMVLATSVFAVACSESAPSANDSARITVLLTDAPGDVTAAVVTISAIYLQGGSSQDSSASANGRMDLLAEPVTTDLLTLADDVATLVDGAVVPEGNYGQLRFVIDGAYLEVETDDGVEVYATPGYAEAPATVNGELKCPSCSQSGIKVILPGALELTNDDETLLVDFDVAESFGHQAGNSGKWVMHPVIRGSATTGDEIPL